MEADSNSSSLHLVLFPWLAFGHMHPFLELARSLTTRGHRITFISTPRNIQRLPPIPSHLSLLITFVPLTLPHIEPLPENAEATTDIPQEHVQYLEKAFDGLAAPFSAFFESACSDKSTKPNCVIMDAHHHWLPKIAHVFHVPCAFFVVIPPSSMAFMQNPSDSESRTATEHFTVPPSWIPFPSNLAFFPHEARWIVMGNKKNESGISVIRCVNSTIMESDFLCVRASFELDSKWLSLLAELYKKDIVPVGLLPPPSKGVTSASESTGGKLEFDMIEWLDKQPPKSVLYIALGSEAALSTDLLHELAFGLEKSAVPFLWALRKPAGMSGVATDMLPIGFQERLKGSGSGHVALGWVPQMRILAHESIGGFLTHCGPSSVIESSQFGHPLVMLPLIVDQGLIARVLDERGVGVEIPRDPQTGNFDREGVARVVRRIMVEEEGKLIRQNAKQIQPIFTDQISHEKHLNGFIKRLQKYTI